jgi:hypothetical protein
MRSPLGLEFFRFIPCVGRNLDLCRNWDIATFNECRLVQAAIYAKERKLKEVHRGRRVETRKRRTEDNLAAALHSFVDSDCRSHVSQAKTRNYSKRSADFG